MSAEFSGRSLHELGIMAEIDPAIIEQQIADGIAAAGAFGFMNNFSEYLPGGVARRSDTMMGNAYAAQLDELMPEPAGVRAARTRWLDFFADIDQAFSDAASLEEIDPKEIAVLRESRQRDALSLHVLPVYRRMRQKGYSHYDLFG